MEHLDLNAYENDALEDVDELLDLVLPSMNRMGDISDSSDSTSLVRLLGDFLDGQLANLGWSIAKLSERTQIDTKFLEDILNGTATNQDISDELLNILATTLDYDANILRIVMRRDIVPTKPEEKPPHKATLQHEPFGDDYSELQNEIEKHLDVITQLFLQTIDDRYSSNLKHGAKNQIDYDLAIKEIQIIIAQHRADVKHVESLLEQLKSAPSALKQGNDDADLSRRDIWRIIEVIKTETSSIR